MKNSFSRTDGHRKSMMRNLVSSLILYEEIKTTQAKAKELKSTAEKLLQKSRTNDLTARRILLSYLFDKNAVNKFFEDILPKIKEIKSGFVKVYKIGPRLGDGAQMAIVKLDIAREIKVTAKEIQKDKLEEKKDAKKETGKKSAKEGGIKTKEPKSVGKQAK